MLMFYIRSTYVPHLFHIIVSFIQSSLMSFDSPSTGGLTLGIPPGENQYAFVSTTIEPNAQSTKRWSMETITREKSSYKWGKLLLSRYCQPMKFDYHKNFHSFVVRRLPINWPIHNLYITYSRPAANKAKEKKNKNQQDCVCFSSFCFRQICVYNLPSWKINKPFFWLLEGTGWEPKIWRE
jgi:hypothetical protein